MIARRHFLGLSVTALASGTAKSAAGQAPKISGRRPPPECYEIRTIKLRIGQQPRVHEFLGQVALPALGRLGVRPVGIFELTFGVEMPTIVMVIPHASPASFATAEVKLAADPAYRKGTAAFDAAAPQPAYVRTDSALLVAFENMPRLELPPEAAEKKPRIFELRTYESPSESASGKKMEMFTKLGEMEIFRRVGLRPVFFGRTLIGQRQPSFVYMLSFPDLAAREHAWATFREDAAWKKLKATAGYADIDIMSNISDLVLRPTSYSQI